ncbi:uncharacterized protein J8A68_001646 [[Candida] subhashii]|uniref:CID domain-containing protein n=1 Tax=[Candida] subhashii TaxID=561895 RepID=A0A8J5QFS2_9ASCO|nr:uncharacterized protein J8A68_001646 [[Candida] subhashii]KAG7664829.1 hypothetical protein J8A68_001646 [[Candida] subhashii]
MDSFEAANQFSQILKTLTPSIQNLTRAAHFALKNSSKEDYLFPIILDILQDDKIELNNKSTIFQFIDILISESFSSQFKSGDDYHYPYIQNIKINLPTIIKLVVPNNDQENTYYSNLYNCYNCLVSISKYFKIDSEKYIQKFNSNQLSTQDQLNIKNNLEFTPDDIDITSPSEDPLVVAWKILLQIKHQSQYNRARLLLNSSPVVDPISSENDLFNIREKSSTTTTTTTTPNNNILSKRQILSRMEDDREAHKRSKEILWLVNRDSAGSKNYPTEEEFLDHYWNKFHRLEGRDKRDFLDSLQDINNLVRQSYKDPQF